MILVAYKLYSQFDIKSSFSSDASNSIFLMIGREAIKGMLMFFYFLKNSTSNLLG